ncbi:uncharacterized protein BO95DRAFT_437765 [Aspergillus brunneoviolaceus CBS 621.78]|uniref:Uncharacterized protein n=1 Tax=Aspergillus brunneoviolaceus CBS 621.78 TaxID=1450534 RepID=A0ACD1GQT5_9EURO|nr:hypothetical protein BO95DRAFT_437765 [Aspergillus brunneoviolaceus CBS 621.78]RAH51597.1 hypothetical protein BO95DRAFT_437765 [Aspergillus brunneoviolaceus CBS 621.78]
MDTPTPYLLSLHLLFQPTHYLIPGLFLVCLLDTSFSVYTFSRFVVAYPYTTTPFVKH